MKQVVILAGPCVRKKIMPEIDRQIEQIKGHQAPGVTTLRPVQFVRTGVIADRLRTSSEGTREKILGAINDKDAGVRIADRLITWEGAAGDVLDV